MSNQPPRVNIPHTTYSPSTTSRVSASVPSKSTTRTLRRSESKERQPVHMPVKVEHPAGLGSRGMKGGENGVSDGMGEASSQPRRDASLEPALASLGEDVARTRKNRTRPADANAYGGVPTLETITDDGVLSSPSRPPPPAASKGAAIGLANGATRPVNRPRRSSSIRGKPSPGAVPATVVDWEIPRKTFHSSIGKWSIPDKSPCRRLRF
jgi:hypothetical protein